MSEPRENKIKKKVNKKFRQIINTVERYSLERICEELSDDSASSPGQSVDQSVRHDSPEKERENEI